MDIIIADFNKVEKAFLADYESLDIEINDIGVNGNNNTGNTFELKMDKKSSDKYNIEIYDYIYCPDTEFGGIIKSVQVQTDSEEIIWFGITFRGLLTGCIFDPGDDDRTIGGELNEVLHGVLSQGSDAGAIFNVSDEDTGIIVDDIEITDYQTKGEVIAKILKSLEVPRRLEIYLKQGREFFELNIKTEEIINYSNTIEFSQDTNIPVKIMDDKTGVTHLIAIGKVDGENIREDLWLNEEGDIIIGENPEMFTGAKGKTVAYQSDNSESLDDLIDKAKQEFIKIKNSMSIEISDIKDTDAQIGDIISGRDYDTKIKVQEPITGKIVKFEKDGTVLIETKTEGSNSNE